MPNPRDALAGRIALVTGATGFIGAHLCRSLLESGAEVHAAARSEMPFNHAHMRGWKLDVADFEPVRDCVQAVRPDYVFHLASYVMGAPELKHVMPAFHGNLQSTVNVLTSLAEIGCRRVLLTGSLVEPPPGQSEDVPSSPYAAAKWASAQYGRMFHALYGLPVAVARVFMVYGPAQRDRSKLVPYVIRALLKGEAPEITSGRRLIDWIYVQDVVDGFLALAASEGVDGQSIDLGSGQLISTHDLVMKIAMAIGAPDAPRFGSLPDRPMEPLRKADVAQAEALIGWRPRIDLDEGLKRTIAHYRSEDA